MKRRYILFSAVGLTDPITGRRDGAILHICRKYKPEIIYLFLSKQINENHIKDNRYCQAIQKLSELIEDFNPRIEIIADEKLYDVHKFDVFYETYESKIDKIQEAYPDYTILINISSGTPAMKNALNLISTLHEDNIKAIQVSAPTKDIGYQYYDIEARWKENLDNDPNEFEDRTSEEPNLNLTARIKKEVILKHIKVYDYQAAYSIAQDISNSIPTIGMQLLKAACCRIQLDEKGMEEALCSTNYHPVPYTDEIKRSIIEFLLWLQIKQKRHDYADFIRGITPVVADLFEIILKAHTGIYLPDYCSRRRKGNQVIYYICRDKLLMTEKGQEILKIEDDYFQRTTGEDMKDGFYKSLHSYALLEHYKKDDPILIDTCHIIRDVESKVRNLASHEIVSITDEWIKTRCKLNSKEIMDKLKYLAKAARIVDTENVWESYNEMNQKIEELIIDGK